jgi:glutamyl-tRNA synthetase
LGLDWDGPVLHQSERFAIFHRAIHRLQKAGHVYPCFCTRAEIREAASAPHDDLPEGAYPGTCRGLSTAEQQRRIGEGRPHALRVRIEFTDRLPVVLA